MKKIVFLLLFITVISSAFAQTVKYGISGGLNSSTVVSPFDPANNTRLSFHAGAFSDISWGSISIQPGLFYTSKIYASNSAKQPLVYLNDGTSGNGSQPYTTYYSRQKINYIQLPVNVLYHANAGSGSLFIGGGPYVAYGLSGTSGNYSVTSDGVTTSTTTIENASLHFGSGNDAIQRTILGLNAVGGYALHSGLFISAGFDHELTNVNHNGFKQRNGTLTLSLGFNFM